MQNNCPINQYLQDKIPTIYYVNYKLSIQQLYIVQHYNVISTKYCYFLINLLAV